MTKVTCLSCFCLESRATITVIHSSIQTPDGDSPRFLLTVECHHSAFHCDLGDVTHPSIARVHDDLEVSLVSANYPHAATHTTALRDGSSSSGLTLTGRGSFPMTSMRRPCPTISVISSTTLASIVRANARHNVTTDACDSPRAPCTSTRCHQAPYLGLRRQPLRQSCFPSIRGTRCMITVPLCGMQLLMLLPRRIPST